MIKYLRFGFFIFGIFATTSLIFSQIIPSETEIENTLREEFSLVDKLTGTWIWIKTKEALSGKITTPKTTGHNYRIEFTKDSIYRVFKDSIKISDNKYSIEYNTYIKIKGVLIQSATIIGRDTLYLNDVCPDCPGSMYIRKKINTK
ncbi:MAG TPA: hypothetical protein VIH57_03665 [Bacteroidales bacterium]